MQGRERQEEIKIRQFCRPEDEERCVVCGGKTGYRCKTPIDERQFYFVGVGQLCEKCYREIYERREER